MEQICRQGPYECLTGSWEGWFMWHTCGELFAEETEADDGCFAADDNCLIGSVSCFGSSSGCSSCK